MSGLIIDDVSMRFELPTGDFVQALKNVSLELKAGELMSVSGALWLWKNHAPEHRCRISGPHGGPGHTSRCACHRTGTGTGDGFSARGSL